MLDTQNTTPDELTIIPSFTAWTEDNLHLSDFADGKDELEHLTIIPSFTAWTEDNLPLQ